MLSREPQDETPLYRYRFGAVEFDEARQTLQLNGLPVELEQRPLQVLAELLRYPDEVVTREELLDTVWAGRPTVDNVVANAMAKLRKALGETESARIVTLPRVGYRIAGPIERHAVGRKRDSRLELKAGMPVPGRAHFLLEAQLSLSLNGEVWLARQPKTRETRVYKFSPDGERLAALKREATLYRVLHESLGTREDIARILDWNFETPPFFLECEYGGLDLQAWATSHLAALSPEARIALFLQIADAVAAAHGIGVLHKDLKPANVLVSPRDGAAQTDRWQLRIADFGSGRLLDPDRLAELGITRLGLTVTQGIGSDASSGTPLYLAPELLGGQAPTAQSDLFALGLMLYQLIVGDLRKPMASGWEQDVNDDLLCEDIAAATDGNPARRLASVAELAERLRTREARWAERGRLLEIEARAVAAERIVERTRARRPLLIAAIAILLLGLGTSLWFYRLALLSERGLAKQYAVLRAVNGFMTDDLIGAANPRLSGRSNLTVVEAAKSAAAKIDTSFAADAPAIQAALHRAMQEAFSGLSDSEAAVGEGRKAIEAYRTLDPPDLANLTETKIRLAADLAGLSRDDESAAMLDEVEKDLPALVGKYPLLQVKYWSARGQVEGDRLNLKASLEYDKRAWTLIQMVPDAPPDLRDRLEFGLADSLRMVGDYKDGEQLLRDLVLRQSQRLGPQHAQTLYSIAALGSSLAAQERFDEATGILLPAIDGLVASLGAKHRRTLLAQGVLAGIFFNQRKFDQAGSLYSQIHDGLAEKYGETSQQAIAYLLNVAMSKQYAGDPRAAETLYRQALTAARSVFPEDNAQVQSLRYHLADCLLDLHHQAEVASLLAGLSAETLNQSEREPDWDGRLAYQSGRLALAGGNATAALPLLEKAAQEIGEKNPGNGMISLESVQALIRKASSQVGSQAAARSASTQSGN